RVRGGEQVRGGHRACTPTEGGEQAREQVCRERLLMWEGEGQHPGNRGHFKAASKRGPPQDQGVLHAAWLAYCSNRTSSRAASFAAISVALASSHSRHFASLATRYLARHFS